MESPTLEYIIKQRNEGSVLFKKCMMILCYIAMFVIFGLLVILLSAPAFQMLFLILDFILCAIIAFATWRFVSVEYELTFSSGELSLTTIYGKSLRRQKLSIPINSVNEIGIYDEAAYNKLCNTSLQKNYFSVSSMSADIIYYATFDEGKDHCVLYFEADERAISYLRRENSSAVRAGNIK